MEAVFDWIGKKKGKQRQSQEAENVSSAKKKYCNSKFCVKYSDNTY